MDAEAVRGINQAQGFFQESLDQDNKSRTFYFTFDAN